MLSSRNASDMNIEHWTLNMMRIEHGEMTYELGEGDLNRSCMMKDPIKGNFISKSMFLHSHQYSPAPAYLYDESVRHSLCCGPFSSFKTIVKL